MRKLWAAAVFAAIGAALWAIAFVVGVPQVQREIRATTPPPPPHLATDPTRRLDRVEVIAVYFVPRNRAAVGVEEWRPPLEQALTELGRFHRQQLDGRSTLTTQVHPAAIVGWRDGLDYDTTVTQHGNPEALRRIAAELETRLLAPGGDLYRDAYRAPADGTYRTLLILYEGVGAAGAVGAPAAILSRLFFAKPEYRGLGASLLAHEFYHTLGLDDGYTPAHGAPTSPDLMGQGRYRPLTRTFLSRRAQRAFGL
jgi:hypothetical protein